MLRAVGHHLRVVLGQLLRAPLRRGVDLLAEALVGGAPLGLRMLVELDGLAALLLARLVHEEEVHLGRQCRLKVRMQCSHVLALVRVLVEVKEEVRRHNAPRYSCLHLQQPVLQ